MVAAVDRGGVIMLHMTAALACGVFQRGYSPNGEMDRAADALARLAADQQVECGCTGRVG